MSGEDNFIRRHFAPMAGPGGLGLRDDAALITPPAGHDLVVTVDAIVAGVHFLPNDSPGDIARKALRVNLSDLAAKGATPAGFLLTLALPRDFDDASVASFAQALADDAKLYACPLLGGDTVSTPGPLTISITAFGVVPHGTMVRRDGAKSGDSIYVTGTIGDAALGLLVCRNDARVRDLMEAHHTYLADRYRNPQPRSGLADTLRANASAAMDVSDGFAGDLTKMFDLAGLSTAIPWRDIPLSPAATAAISRNPDLRKVVLTCGDDYEILCAVSPEKSEEFEAGARAAQIAVRQIGVASMGATGASFTDEGGRTIRLDRLSYSHL